MSLPKSAKEELKEEKAKYLENLKEEEQSKIRKVVIKSKKK